MKYYLIYFLTFISFVGVSQGYECSTTISDIRPIAYLAQTRNNLVVEWEDLEENCRTEFYSRSNGLYTEVMPALIPNYQITNNRYIKITGNGKILVIKGEWKLNNSTVIFENDGPIRIEGSVKADLNSRFIVKSSQGHDIDITYGSGHRTFESYHNSAIRIFSGKDIHVRDYNIQFDSGWDAFDNDNSQIKFVAQNSMYIEDYTSFNRYGNAKFVYIIKGYLVNGRFNSSYGYFVRYTDYSSAETDAFNFKYGEKLVAGTIELTTNLKAKVNCNVDPKCSIGFEASLSFDPLQISQIGRHSDFTKLERGANPNNFNLSPNICGIGSVNWYYNFDDEDRPNLVEDFAEKRTDTEQNVLYSGINYKIYPNPVSDKLNIESNYLDDEFLKNVKIYTLRGELIYNLELNNKQNINISLKDVILNTQLVMIILETNKGSRHSEMIKVSNL